MKATLLDLCAGYRLLLGREADIDGLVHYAQKIYDGISVETLRECLLASEEFRTSQNQRGVRVELDDKLFVVVDRNEPEFGCTIYRDRTWEPHIVELITQNLRPGDVYVDVGANVGVMAFYAAKTVGPSGKVLAFEPDRTNCNRFLQGVLANGFENVLLYPVALSDRVGLFSLRGSSNTYLVQERQMDRLIQSFPGDKLLASEPRINFLKIDVEGHEPFALQGLKKILQQHKPKVLCEFNPRCLRDHAAVRPETFAGDLFRMTKRLEVVEYDGHRNRVMNGPELMALWHKKNNEAVRTGHLENGMLHFDLLFQIDPF